MRGNILVSRRGYVTAWFSKCRTLAYSPCSPLRPEAEIFFKVPSSGLNPGSNILRFVAILSLLLPECTGADSGENRAGVPVAKMVVTGSDGPNFGYHRKVRNPLHC